MLPDGFGNDLVALDVGVDPVVLIQRWIAGDSFQQEGDQRDLFVFCHRLE